MLRVLFLTNFYPPASRGGYEEWCQEVAEGLRNRRHDIVVLTTRNSRSAPSHLEPSWIHRDLHLEMEFASLRNSLQFFTSRTNHENENLVRLQQYIEDFEPDVILIWGMWNMPRSLSAKAEELLPGRVVYYMGDYWPTLPSQWQNYWQASPRNWVTAVPKLLLKPVANYLLSKEKRPSLKLEKVIFPTAFLQDEFVRQGIEPEQSTIIYGAIDTHLYENGHHLDKAKDDLVKLLYVGRLAPEKGTHTAIEALGILVKQKVYGQLKLMIVGTGEPDYEAHLHALVDQQQVRSMVEFLGAQPKEVIPDLYHAADILLFTSIWPEPFGRVPVEAMASGVAVIGTAVGGAAEVMEDNFNALLFTPGDAQSLAGQLARLIASPGLKETLVANGRHTAHDKFDIQRMLSEIETYLKQTARELDQSTNHGSKS
jgi:glycosyltransferase involved in cell wall biosynthesis